MKKNYARRGAQDVAREVMSQESQNTDRTSRENLSLWGCDAGVPCQNQFQPRNMHRSYYQRSNDLNNLINLIMLIEHSAVLSLFPPRPRRSFLTPVSFSTPYRCFKSTLYRCSGIVPKQNPDFQCCLPAPMPQRLRQIGKLFQDSSLARTDFHEFFSIFL